MAKLTVAGVPIDGNWRVIDSRLESALRDADLLVGEERRSALRLLALTGSRDKALALLNEHAGTDDIKAVADLIMAARHTVFVSEAGTPCIADPDYRLVDECIRRGAELRSVPGPSSIITAISVSGFPADRFIFLGFPPREGKGRREFFSGLSAVPYTSVFLERPYALERTLEEMAAYPQEISLSIALGSPEERNFRGRPAALKKMTEGVKAPFAVVLQKIMGKDGRYGNH